jgi:hypothetical protein
MAFSATGWATIGASKRGNAPSIYSYSTTDAIADINTSGYFNSLANSLSVGDLIYCFSSTGGTPAAHLVWVVSNSSGVVDVTNGQVITATDSD